MKKILVVDNYDSFTYNLVHYLEKCSSWKIDVIRNDKIDPDSIRQYDKIVLSPGPGLPKEKKNLLPLIGEYAPQKSILGVCLGHQAIAQSFGGKIYNLDKVYHGVKSPARIIQKDTIFNDIPCDIYVGRYHSWGVIPSSLPTCLEVTMVDNQNEIMAIRHRQLDIKGVQFHPESILTEYGEKMIDNWLKN